METMPSSPVWKPRRPIMLLIFEQRCLALPDPRLLDLFDHVYAEQTPYLVAQKAEHAEYMATFEDVKPESGEGLRQAQPAATGPASRRRGEVFTDDHADHRKGAQCGSATGPGGRSQGRDRWPGRGQAWRCLPGHRGIAEGFWRASGDRFAACGIGHCRHRAGDGAARLSARCARSSSMDSSFRPSTRS